jgi:hypothetical protein
MKSGLSAQQLEAFERDGFLVVEEVLPVGTVTRITQSVLDVR